MKKNKKGFSLLELIVVCAIIGIMSVLILIFFSQNRKDRKVVEVAGREVAAAMREVQNYALSGKVSGNNQFLCSTSFTATQNTGNYGLLYTYHTGDQICNDAGTYYQKTLRNNVVFTSVSGGVTMTTPHASFSPATSQRYTLGKNGTTYYYICFCSTGKVYESTTGCDIIANC